MQKATLIYYLIPKTSYAPAIPRKSKPVPKNRQEIKERLPQHTVNNAAHTAP